MPLLWTLLVACGGPSPWAETTTPFDPACGGCVEIGAGDLGHSGDVRILVDLDVDDPQAQWARCVDALMGCLEDVAEPRTCVADAACPAACETAFDRAVRGVDDADLEALLDGVEATFFDPEGPCGPPVEVSL